MWIIIAFVIGLLIGITISVFVISDNADSEYVKEAKNEAMRVLSEAGYSFQSRGSWFKYMKNGTKKYEF
jgi:hypothetical protein